MQKKKPAKPLTKPELAKLEKAYQQTQIQAPDGSAVALVWKHLPSLIASARRCHELEKQIDDVKKVVM